MDSENAQNMTVELREDLHKIFRVHTLIRLRSFSAGYKTQQAAVLKQYIDNAVAEIERIAASSQEGKCADDTGDGLTNRG
jgi:hypothetical protein